MKMTITSTCRLDIYPNQTIKVLGKPHMVVSHQDDYTMTIRKIGWIRYHWLNVKAFVRRVFR